MGRLSSGLLSGYVHSKLGFHYIFYFGIYRVHFNLFLFIVNKIELLQTTVFKFNLNEAESPSDPASYLCRDTSSCEGHRHVY